MESDMAAYKSDFLQEVYECLDVFNQAFVDLENGDCAAIDEIFRIAHTIKGMAGFLGYKSLEHLCHNMEEVLCGIKNGDIEIDGELVDIMLSTVDRITDMVKQIENNDTDNVEIDDLLEVFGNYINMRESGQVPLCIREPVENNVLSSEIISLKSAEDNSSLDLKCLDKQETSNICNAEDCNLVLDITLSEDCMMKDLRASLIIESLRDICKVVKTNPDEDEMDSNFNGNFTVFLSGDGEKVEELMDRITEIECFNIVSNEKPECCNPTSGESQPIAASTPDAVCSSTSEDSLPIAVSTPDAVCSSISEDSQPIAVSTPDAVCSSTSEDSQPIAVSTPDAVCSSTSEDSQPIAASTPSAMHEATADSSAINSNIFTSTLQNLVTKIRFILNKMNKQIICSKSTGCAGTLSEDKYKSFPGDEQKSQESQLLEKTSVEIPGQESLLDEVQFLEESSEENIDPDLQLDEVRFPEEPSEEISDLDLQLDKVQLLEESPEETLYPDLQLDEVLFLKEPPEEIPGPDLQSDEVQFLEEPSEEIPGQGFKSQEIQKTGILDSDSSLEADSSSPISESVKSEKMSSESKRQETIRVRTSNLDNIMNLVGELVINKGRLLQISQEYNLPELEEATATLDKSISSLQDEVMRIRMVKIERVFSKFPRMVRDLSRKFNKNIDFEIEGQDTELDRTILDEINDPLVHLVRNAVDHGIESPEEREQAGKSEIGHIKLSARREKNNVIIEIEDDGKGMDLELLKKKALEKGLLSAFDLENLSEDEIRMLIFTPGFSTKDTATEISGRGVGMDAVKTAVEKLGGKVRVYSKKGEYTKIRIDLPPTVAIIKSLLVEVGSETYAIPISNVVKALSVDSNDYKFVKETPLLYIRDKLLPVLKLKEIFNIPCEKLDKELAIIVEKENEEVGLIVDSIIDQQEIVIKPLGNIFSDLKGFIGVTILGDGRVIPILDVSVLIRGDIDD